MSGCGISDLSDKSRPQNGREGVERDAHEARECPGVVDGKFLDALLNLEFEVIEMLWDIRALLEGKDEPEQSERIVAPEEPGPAEITQKRERPKSLDAELAVINLNEGSIRYLPKREFDWIVGQAQKTGVLIVPFEAAGKFYSGHARWTKNRERSEGDGESER